MPEKPTKVPLPNGTTADGFDVPIAEALERWSELKLEDGTVLRVKMNVAAVIRLKDQWDELGNPIYFMNAAPAVAAITTPENLKRKKS